MSPLHMYMQAPHPSPFRPTCPPDVHLSQGLEEFTVCSIGFSTGHETSFTVELLGVSPQKIRTHRNCGRWYSVIKCDWYCFEIAYRLCTPLSFKM